MRVTLYKNRVYTVSWDTSNDNISRAGCTTRLARSRSPNYAQLALAAASIRERPLFVCVGSPCPHIAYTSRGIFGYATAACVTSDLCFTPLFVAASCTAFP